MKTRFSAWINIFALILSSCSMEVTPPASVIPTPQTQAAPSANPSLGGVTQSNLISSTQIPITWSHLKLTGRLVYINGIMLDSTLGFQIQILDLVTGKLTTIFDAPKYASIYYITISPDTKQLVMSYSPPPGDEPVDQDLYMMPLDGSQPPQLLFVPPTKNDDYIEAEYSSDGKYLYYTHLNKATPLELGQVYPLYDIFRMELPNGPAEKIAEKASWPRLSADSSLIAYVSFDPFSLGNKLYLANADGTNAHEVVLLSPLPPEIKDAPLFSSDGQSILFSAPISAQSYQPNWVDKLTGLRIAKAHGDLTSDWWSVPVTGGTITQLTNIQSSNLFGSFAPDGKHVASSSADGIFIMEPDGSELTMLVPNPQAVMGAIRWLP